MNFRALLNILGALLTILGLTMIFPIVVSLIFGESDWRAFSVSSAMCIFIGFPSWYITRNNRSLTNRDGFVIVTFSWLCTAIIGTLPFYISGVIPFSAEIGNSISNDGDALFPAIAIAPRVAAIATVYSALPAFVVAYGYYWLFE